MNPDELQRLKERAAEIASVLPNAGPELSMRLALDHERNVQLQKIADKLEALLIEAENQNSILRNRS